MDKLASHQLPRTSAWILKTVQAGVVAGSSGMWVSHGMRSCKIRFKGGHFGTLEEIREAWIEPLPIEDRARQHLSVALRTLAFSRRRPVLLVSCCEHQGLRSIFWDGSTMSKVGPAADSVRGTMTPGELLVFVSRSPLGRDATQKKVHGVSDVTAAEFKELTSFAVCSPMPLWVDNRPLNHFGMEDVSMMRRSLAFSAQPQTSDSPSLKLPPEVAQTSGVDRASLAWTLYHHAKERENSRIGWVKDGVVCEEQDLHSQAVHFQVRLFVPADDLDTDLTELQLRFPDPDLRRRRIASAVLAFCSDLGRQDELTLEIAKSLGRSSKHWGVASVLLLGGVLFAPATSGFSLLASAGAMVGVAADRALEKPTVPSSLVRFVQELESKYRPQL